MDDPVEIPFPKSDFIESWIDEAEKENAVREHKAAEKSEILLIDGAHVSVSGLDYIVSVPVKEGRAVITFTEISRSHQSFSTVITVKLVSATDGELTPFSQRIDLNSSSAVETLRRALDNAYGKTHNWTLVLNKAANAIRTAFAQEQKPTFVTDDGYEKVPFLITPFLQRGASNMVFGDSEVGKTYFCLRLAASLASGAPFLGFESPGGVRTLFLDYEDSKAIFNNRLFEICAGLSLDKKEVASNIAWYRPEGTIRDEASTISRFILEHKFDLIIIDAGSNAVGGSPNDEQIVVQMFNALEHIPCTKLIIHHEPKDVSGVADNKAFYGTTFWRALTRVAWRLVLENEEDGKLIKAVIAKKSNLGKVEPFMYRQKWGIRGWESPDEMLPFNPTYFERVEMTPGKSFKEKIVDCLTEHGELTKYQIMEMTGIGNNYWKEISQEMKQEGALGVRGNTRGAVWYLKTAPPIDPTNNSVPPQED
jgi:hypothetical protein